MMVGFVQAGDVDGLESGGETTAGIGFYLGDWDPMTTQCIPSTTINCGKLVFSFDMRWIKDLFN
ncbi:MAG: hypothetical protein HQ507_00510 [Candidatus Marinimicrobia bacterium]|nr:hypothetical protein [Candidatus Neomarinimicrobiota bacterium]